MKPARQQLVRYALVAACLVLTGASFVSFFAGQRQRDELVDLLREAGFDHPADHVIDRVRSERSAHHAQVLAGRALLFDVLDARSGPADAAAAGAAGERPALELGSTEWDAAVDRLPIVADLARRVLEIQPNSWQAAMLLGAAVYLERSVRRDRRLFTAYRDWEAPLERALSEAPGQAEPRRFLAAAYLEVWPALSPQKKDLARNILAQAFADDPQAFSSLLPVWLGVAEDLDDAFAVIPESPTAWQSLERAFAEQRDWNAFCQAHARRMDALYEENGRRLAEAEERLRLGEFFHSRSLLLQVVASSPLDLRFAPLVTRALEHYPPGLHGLASTESLRTWLRWALDLHLFGRNPLPERVTGRLASAAGNLEPQEKALAALASGELHYAERVEQAAETLSSKVWGPYLLAKTRWHLSRGQIDEAATALGLVDRATRRTLAFALTRLEMAGARGDLVELAEAERETGAFRRREWSADQWSWQSYRAYLALLPEAPARGVRLALNRVPAAGAVIEVHWDGRTVALQPVTIDGELELVLPVEEGLHLLEVRMVAGEQLLPGRVSLLDP